MAITVQCNYGAGDRLLSVGEHVKVTCTEVGLIDEILYIAGISYQGKNTGTLIRLTLERYEGFEG
jgi:prophage tail gpP-like protein